MQPIYWGYRVYEARSLGHTVERLLMVQEEKKEESWLQKLCRGDAKLYDILAGSLPLDPMAAISKDDLRTLIAQAEKSVKDKNYEEAVWKYRPIVDKAIFEATLHQDEKDRYVKIIQDLLSKTARATERAKEKAEKEGRTDHVAALVKRIEYCKFVSERIEDVLEVASDFYNERLQILGEKEKGEERREKILKARR
jgi:Fe2+ transport system protein B